jgi:hypothetical protein
VHVRSRNQVGEGRWGLKRFGAVSLQNFVLMRPSVNGATQRGDPRHGRSQAVAGYLTTELLAAFCPVAHGRSSQLLSTAGWAHRHWPG